MALTLNELSKRKQKQIDPDNLGGGKVNDSPQRNVRPWERHDETAPKTRTLRAQEAVKRAREISSRNEQDALPLGHKYDAYTKSSEILSERKDFRIKTRRRSVIQLLRKLIQ